MQSYKRKLIDFNPIDLKSQNDDWSPVEPLTPIEEGCKTFEEFLSGIPTAPIEEGDVTFKELLSEAPPTPIDQTTPFFGSTAQHLTPLMTPFFPAPARVIASFSDSKKSLRQTKPKLAKSESKPIPNITIEKNGEEVLLICHNKISTHRRPFCFNDCPNVLVSQQDYYHIEKSEKDKQSREKDKKGKKGNKSKSSFSKYIVKDNKAYLVRARTATEIKRLKLYKIIETIIPDNLPFFKVIQPILTETVSSTSLFSDFINSDAFRIPLPSGLDEKAPVRESKEVIREIAGEKVILIPLKKIKEQGESFHYVNQPNKSIPKSSDLMIYIPKEDENIRYKRKYLLLDNKPWEIKAKKKRQARKKFMKSASNLPDTLKIEKKGEVVELQWKGQIAKRKKAFCFYQRPEIPVSQKEDMYQYKNREIYIIKDNQAYQVRPLKEGEERKGVVKTTVIPKQIESYKIIPLEPEHSTSITAERLDSNSTQSSTQNSSSSTSSLMKHSLFAPTIRSQQLEPSEHRPEFSSNNSRA